MTAGAQPQPLGGSFTIPGPPPGQLFALDHVGIAVRDVHAAMDRFGTVLGVERWHRSRFRTAAEYLGERQVIGGLVATGQLGPINIELVQPTEGKWTPVDALASRGEGLYHLGYRAGDNLLEAIEQCERQGVGVALRGLAEDDRLLFAYMEAGDVHEVCVELVGAGPMPEGFILEAEEYLVARSRPAIRDPC